MRLDLARGGAWDCTCGRADHLRGRRLSNPSYHVESVGLRFGEERVVMKELSVLSPVEFDHQWLPSKIASLFCSLTISKLKDVIQKKQNKFVLIWKIATLEMYFYNEIKLSTISWRLQLDSREHDNVSIIRATLFTSVDYRQGIWLKKSLYSLIFRKLNFFDHLYPRTRTDFIGGVVATSPCLAGIVVEPHSQSINLNNYLPTRMECLRWQSWFPSSAKIGCLCWRRWFGGL